MWHCSVKPSRRPIRQGSQIYPQALQNAKELLRKGACRVQTLYMTEGMQINRKTARDGETGRRFVPGSY
jgi:hypothetical protein